MDTGERNLMVRARKLEVERLHQRIDYKWIALSHTTLGVLMPTINSSIVLIALPTIFNGIHINPLTPGSTSVLLWNLMGYMVVTPPAQRGPGLGINQVAAIASPLRGRQYFYQEQPAPTAVLEGETDVL